MCALAPETVGFCRWLLWDEETENGAYQAGPDKQASETRGCVPDPSPPSPCVPVMMETTSQTKLANFTEKSLCFSSTRLTLSHPPGRRQDSPAPSAQEEVVGAQGGPQEGNGILGGWTLLLQTGKQTQETEGNP